MSVKLTFGAKYGDCVFDNSSKGDFELKGGNNQNFKDLIVIRCFVQKANDDQHGKVRCIFQMDGGIQLFAYCGNSLNSGA